VSSKRIETTSHYNGNLRMELQSDRAFRVPVTSSNFTEAEFGLPLVINPREIVGAELNFDSRQPVRLIFEWQQDHRILNVVVSEGDSQSSLRFVYDPSIHRYRTLE